MMDILIQNATMVLPDTTVIGDLLIADGIISQIQPGGGLVANENARIIDATGPVSYTHLTLPTKLEV